MPRLAGVSSNSGADGTQRRGFCQAGIDARELTNLGKAEKIRQDRLTPAILISTIGVQSIAATAGVRIDQRHGQIVAAEKPAENPRCDGFPLGIAVRSPRSKAGRDRGCGFHGLLIEGARMLPLFAKTRGADGTERVVRRWTLAPRRRDDRMRWLICS